MYIEMLEVSVFPSVPTTTTVVIVTTATDSASYGYNTCALLLYIVHGEEFPYRVGNFALMIAALQHTNGPDFSGKGSIQMAYE